jgi:phosphatidylethanolamine/phosphatidyl-N-methylethanolamine N-methyltransferase
MENAQESRYLKKWYSGSYKTCYYTGAIGIVYGLVHKLMEIKHKKSVTFSRVLEVGAGNGEHFSFVKHKFDEYYMTDIQEIDLGSGLEDPRIILKQADCTNLGTFEDGYFDRVIATCLLVHLKEPGIALTEWRRVVKTGGEITIYIAPEPGFLLTLIRKAFIWPKTRKMGILDPEYFAYSEHINHYPRMNTLVKDVFRNDKIKRRRFPFKFSSWQFSLFEILDIKIAKKSND